MVRKASQLKDHWREQKQFGRRVIVCGVLALLLISIVVARLALLQIAGFEHYSAQSQGNRIRVQPLPPTRGLIYDRNGIVLAENLPSYQLEITPEQVPDLDETLARLGAIGLIEEENIPRIKQNINSRRRFDSVPLRRRVPDTVVARFAVQRPYFPGVEIRARLARNYPNTSLAAHALGYVSGINADDQASLDPAAYAGTSFIGKTAVERAYEEDLHGDVGREEVLVNVYGRQMQSIETELAVPGRDLILTIDIELQRAAEKAMEGFRGAAVAIDPNNGEILVLASAPSFDPNGFITGLTPNEFREMQDDLDQPLFNRAIRGSYPPGSTVKPIIALAAIEHGTLNPARKMYCPGFYSLPGKSHRYRDWKLGGHGLVDMQDAIAQSCDTYFYAMANNMGIDPMSDIFSRFGLGTRTGIDLGG
ncbi:MAG: penicillin-binding protein 2, partial [Gammaproteobacteria bacterium]